MKNGFKYIGNHEIISIILASSIFVVTVVLTSKTIFLKKQVNDYDNYITTIDNKISTEVEYYYSKQIEIEDIKYKRSAIKELANCLSNPYTINEELIGLTQELQQIFNKSNNNFAFKYEDLYTGFSLSYNENQPIFAASTIKAPTDIYIYQLASENKTSLEEKITYTPHYYNTGSGILKNMSFNVAYPISELVKYSILYSDNAAHNMLIDTYGRGNILNFYQTTLGTKIIFTSYSNWGETTASDASAYMKYLYNFYLNNEEYGNELMTLFINSGYKKIKGKEGQLVASKSGFSGTVIHDAAIVFSDNPYILVVLTNKGYEDYQSFFNEVSEKISYLHERYWANKINECNNIKQY